MTGPLGLTQQTADRTGTPSDIRSGTVSRVTSRGIDVTVAEGLVENAAHLASYNPAVGDTVTMISYSNSWLVLGRAVGTGTGTTDLTPGTGLSFTILDGMVLSGGGGTMASSTGASVSVPRYGVSFFHPPGHWVALLWSYSWFSSTAADVVQTRLVETVGGTTLGQVEHTQGAAAVGNFATLLIPTGPGLGGTRRSYAMQVQRFSGAGTSRIDDASLRRGSLIAYDLGDQNIIRTV